MKNLFGMFALAIVLFTTSSCHKTFGCTDKGACNWSEHADKDNGTCLYWDAYGDKVDINGNIIVPYCNTNNNTGGGGNNNSGGNTTNTTSLEVWTNSLANGTINVWVGYIDSNTITSSLAAQPECGSNNGFYTQKVVSGQSYEIYAEDNSSYWNITMTISDGCNTLLLNNAKGLSPDSKHPRTKESDLRFHPKSSMRK